MPSILRFLANVGWAMLFMGIGRYAFGEEHDVAALVAGGVGLLVALGAGAGAEALKPKGAKALEPKEPDPSLDRTEGG